MEVADNYTVMVRRIYAFVYEEKKKREADFRVRNVDKNIALCRGYFQKVSFRLRWNSG